MNYNNLFPRLLKNIPRIPPNSFCYDCINDANDNKNGGKNNDDVKCFIPSGKRLVLWFLKHDSDYYSILLEYQSSKIIKCHFKYMSFDKILASGNGTMIWVTQIGRELTLNKLIYLKGKQCKLKSLGEQMDELRHLLETYINNLSHSSFVQLKLPVMSSSSSVLSFAGNLKYLTYNVVSLTYNHNIYISKFLAVFWLTCIDSMNDSYDLYCKDKHGDLFRYQNALINNVECSNFVKTILSIKHTSYENVEKSDDEECEGTESQNQEKGVYIYCLYDKSYKRWKPYKRCKGSKLLDDISNIKRLEEKSTHI